MTTTISHSILIVFGQPGVWKNKNRSNSLTNKRRIEKKHQKDEKIVDMTLDSGAGIIACPKSVGDSDRRMDTR